MRVARLLLLLAPAASAQPERHPWPQEPPAGASLHPPPGAARPREDKSGYHLFRPVPRDLLRELSTDRPDRTESPYTVDAGHGQVEMDLLSFTWDRDTGGGAGTLTRGWAVAASNLKLGLTNRVDLQLLLEPYRRVRREDRKAGRTRRASGAGDLTTRIKINLWGNDSGETAGALMPFVSAPAGDEDLSSNAVEGGLILPFAAALPRGWKLGGMLELDLREDEGGGGGRHVEFIQSLAVGRAIAGPLGGYLELYHQASGEAGAPGISTFDLGLTCALGPDVQLDLGMNIGLTRAAEDLTPFVGLSVRF